MPPGAIDPNELFAQMFGQAMRGGMGGGGFGPGGGVRFGGFGPGGVAFGGAGGQAVDLNELLSGLFGGAAAAGPGRRPGGAPQPRRRREDPHSLQELVVGWVRTAALICALALFLMYPSVAIFAMVIFSMLNRSG
jgi:hypothetical protein